MVTTLAELLRQILVSQVLWKKPPDSRRVGRMQDRAAALLGFVKDPASPEIFNSPGRIEKKLQSIVAVAFVWMFFFFL